MAPGQSPEEVLQLLRVAVGYRRPIAAVYDDCRRLLCPHKLGGIGKVSAESFAISMGARASAALSPELHDPTGVVWPWTSFRGSNCSRTVGTRRPTTLARKPASRKSSWMSRISQKRRHKKGSEGVGQAGSVQSRCESWRWSAGYAARDGRDPRGRKSGSRCGADSSRFPMRAEGEKRFRSAIRNP